MTTSSILRFRYLAITDSVACQLEVHDSTTPLLLVVNVTARSVADIQAVYAFGHREFGCTEINSLLHFSSQVSE